MRALHDWLGITTVYVTHDQREALTMPDRIAVIKKGRIQQIDAPQMLPDSGSKISLGWLVQDTVIVPKDNR